MEDQLRPLGLVLKTVRGDGNCLFRSLAHQLYGDDSRHLELRREAVRYMKEHRSDFEPFLGEEESFEEYVKQLAKPCKWAGEDAIIALAMVHQVQIVVHQLDIADIEFSGSKQATEPLHIVFHSERKHYSSVEFDYYGADGDDDDDDCADFGGDDDYETYAYKFERY